MTFEEIYQDFNDQMNAEFESAFLYLQMSAYFADKGLHGFASWMRNQYEEEIAHAMKFFDYIQERNMAPIMNAFGKPENTWESPLGVFKASLEHEQLISSKINNLMSLAIDKKDYPSKEFLGWFITEQVEEEGTVQDIIDRLNLVKDAPSGLFFMDNELGKRSSVVAE